MLRDHDPELPQRSLAGAAGGQLQCPSEEQKSLFEDLSIATDEESSESASTTSYYYKESFKDLPKKSGQTSAADAPLS